MPPPDADPFLQTARLVPVAYALHVLEEAPGFAPWVRRHAARDYTDAEFVRINSVGFVSTLAATAALVRGRRGGFAYYTVVLTQQALWNPVFHAGTTVAWGEYSPGLVTSIVVFLPLWALATRRAVNAGQLSPRRITVAVTLGGAIHAAAVADQVFHVRRRHDAARNEDRT